MFCRSSRSLRLFLAFLAIKVFKHSTAEIAENIREERKDKRSRTSGGSVNQLASRFVSWPEFMTSLLQGADPHSSKFLLDQNVVRVVRRDRKDGDILVRERLDK